MEGVRAAHLRGHSGPRQRRRTGFSWPPLLLVACLLGLRAGAAPAADQIDVERRNDVLQLTWKDAEDRLQGAFYPAVLRPGEPIQVSLHVGSFQGLDFDGPLTLTFQQEGSPTQETRTLTRGPVNWTTTFTPPEAGTWRMSVRFRTTRLKVLHARFGVQAPPLSPTLAWSLLGAVALGALALGTRALFRREPPAAPPADPPHGEGATPAADPPVDTGLPPPTDPASTR